MSLLLLYARLQLLTNVCIGVDAVGAVDPDAEKNLRIPVVVVRRASASMHGVDCDDEENVDMLVQQARREDMYERRRNRRGRIVQSCRAASSKKIAFIKRQTPAKKSDQH